MRTLLTAEWLCAYAARGHVCLRRGEIVFEGNRIIYTGSAFPGSVDRRIDYGYAGNSSRRAVSAFIPIAFAQDTPEAAKLQWHSLADQIRLMVSKPSTIMDTAESAVLAYMTLPKEQRAKLQSTNPV